MLAGGAAGGTIAWLVTSSTPVTNVFTSGRIVIDVAETDTGDDDDLTTNTYTMLPGATISKDPVVTVHAGSEDAWLFVKMEKSLNFDTFLTYAMADGWNALENADGVYWRTVSKSDEAQRFDVIANHTVLVKADVTAYMLNSLTPDTRPTLTVTTYAVQRTGIANAAQAWALMQDQSTNP